MTEPVYEYKVTWFPPERKEQTFRTRMLDSAERVYATVEEEGSFPCLERREIPTPPPWDIIRNSGSDWVGLGPSAP